MFLASKIEEMYTPEIGDFVYITDNAYSASMIRSLETKMAKLLDYNFGDPLCIHFLRRDSKAAKVCFWFFDQIIILRFWEEILYNDLPILG